MLDEPGSAMESEDAYGDAGVIVAFEMSGPLVVEEFDGENARVGETRRPDPKPKGKERIP